MARGTCLLLLLNTFSYLPCSLMLPGDRRSALVGSITKCWVHVYTAICPWNLLVVCWRRRGNFGNMISEYKRAVSGIR
jgi:hypothetical protein